MCAAAELGLHAHHQVEHFFALDDLGHGLSPDRGRNHGLDIGDVDSIARNLVAVDIDQQARLSKFTDHGQVGKPGSVGQRVLDLDGFVLENGQILSVDLDRQRAL